jgi:hypothetical protein
MAASEMGLVLLTMLALGAAASIARLRKGCDQGEENLHPPIEYRMRRASSSCARRS